MKKGRMSTTYLGGRWESNLILKFKDLAHSCGISMQEAIRRVITQAVLEGRIPGIDSLDLEQRENQKWGSATPVFDGPNQTKKPVSGKVSIEPRDGSAGT